jgi:hypothetical protein
MLLRNNFLAVYPGGSVMIGGGNTVSFTSASAITAFLPNGGTPSQLTRSYVNPNDRQLKNVLAAQVLALRLNVDFSNRGVLPTGLSSLRLTTTKYAGWTVFDVLMKANFILGGGALDPGKSLADLNDAVTTINENFDNGTNKGNLAP